MELKSWLNGRILVYAQVGDTDACGSFVAFRELAEKLNKDVELEFAIGTLNRDGKKILETFKLQAKEFEDVVEQEFEKIVLVDTQPNQMPHQFAKLDILMIDHHQKAKDLPAHNFWNPDVASTTEIIYNLFLKNSLEPSKDSAKAILFGMIADTAGMRFIKTKSIGSVYHLLNDNKIEYAELLTEIFDEKDYSEKIACLKAAQRLKIKPFGASKILVVSEIGGSESAVASKLISLGADIALVVSKKPNETRIIGRAKKGWNMAEVFQKVSGAFPGMTSGGHPGAAVINMPAEKETVALSKIMKILCIE